MSYGSIEFVICPHCGSTEYMDDYPCVGERICTKCGHESKKIKLKIIEEYKETSDTCPFCGKEGEEDDTFFDNDDNILIFKCKKCGELDGYSFIIGPTGGFGGAPDSLSIKIAKNEGTFVHSASKCNELKKEWKQRENDPIEKCKKQLDYLIYSLSPELSAAGIDYKTINSAKEDVHFFMKLYGPQTNKKLKSLFAAALLNIPENTFTERQLEKISGVTRKTIRHWKEILQKEKQKERTPLKWGVLACNKEGQTIDVIIEIPKDIKTITRLEKPFKDKCHFCLRIELISWRIQYVDGSWSNICKSNYDRLCKYAIEYDWKIEAYLQQ